MGIQTGSIIILAKYANSETLADHTYWDGVLVQVPVEPISMGGNELLKLLYELESTKATMCESRSVRRRKRADVGKIVALFFKGLFVKVYFHGTVTISVPICNRPYPDYFLIQLVL